MTLYRTTLRPIFGGGIPALNRDLTPAELRHFDIVEVAP